MFGNFARNPEQANAKMQELLQMQSGGSGSPLGTSNEFGMPLSNPNIHVRKKRPQVSPLQQWLMSSFGLRGM